jgi:hypothetical protein
MKAGSFFSNAKAQRNASECLKEEGRSRRSNVHPTADPSRKQSIPRFAVLSHNIDPF